MGFYGSGLFGIRVYGFRVGDQDLKVQDLGSGVPNSRIWGPCKN